MPTTVLRIKRKATEAPLSSLVISDERARKRRDVGKGVFKLAHTVPHTWKGEGAEGEQLRTRIDGLLKSSSATPAEALTPGAGSAGAGVETPASRSDGAVAAETDLAERLRSAPPAPPRTGAQYRVVRRESKVLDTGMPPRIITNAEIAAAKSALVFVDAQAVSGEQDEDVAAFLPMLQEYLRMDRATDMPPPPRTEDDEYVFDLYYKDDNAAAEGADIGHLLGYEDLSPPSPPPDSEPEDEADEDSNEEDYYRNDYPEDEDADSDMEGFEDAYSDGAWSDNGDDVDERGVWDYR